MRGQLQFGKPCSLGSNAVWEAMTTALALLYDSKRCVGDPTAMGWGKMENLQERPIHLYKEYARLMNLYQRYAWEENIIQLEDTNLETMVVIKFLEMIVDRMKHEAMEMKEEQATRKHEVFGSFRNRQKSHKSFLEGGRGIIDR